MVFRLKSTITRKVQVNFKRKKFSVSEVPRTDFVTSLPWDIE